MNVIIEGLPLSGKTTRLIEAYCDFVRQGVPTDSILVLVMNIREARKWREAIDIAITGKLQILTYWGFIQKELVSYWHWVLPQLGEGRRPVKPTFLNAEASHYLMNLIVENRRSQGAFDDLVATSSQIALQILNNLNQAAINGTGIDEVTRRLLLTCPGEAEKEQALKDARDLAEDFRGQCLQARCLDYSLCVELFAKHVLTAPGYQESLKKRFTALLADNLEEAIPAETDLVSTMIPFVNSCLAYDPSGGHTRSFGADPVYARESLYPSCQVETTAGAYGCSQEAAELSRVLSANIADGAHEQIRSAAVNASGIDSEFRAEMISQVARSVIRRLNEGTAPGDIAVIAPIVDKVLEYNLMRDIAEAGYQVQNISQRQYLVNESFAQVMVSIASFIRPEEGWISNRSTLSRCFQVVFGLDPVRSSLLAAHCLAEGRLRLPDLDEAGLRERIGFQVGERFDSFKGWVQQISAIRPTPDSLFQSIFTDILARVIEDPDDIAATRQLIASSLKFNEAYQLLPILQRDSFVGRFLDLISKGTIAAERLFGKELQDEAVVLATPLAVIRSGLSFPCQYWLDCTDTGWFLKDFRELSNSAIMGKDWDGRWNDAIEQQVRLGNAARTISGLLYRCRGSVTLVASEYNNMGHHLDGSLTDIIYESVVSR